MRLGSDTILVAQDGEVRIPVPPPFPQDLGVWVKVYAAERAVGVEELLGEIQVSVSARNWRPWL